jgi:UDP-N-acetyl-D-glucosamine dehydrogenase
MPFYPGPGLGGHCIPIDPHYLAWKLRALNYKVRFIELATEINASMPYYVVQKITDALNERRRSINGSRLLLLGVAYKRNTSDVRESPALDIIELLCARGGQVAYHDPFVQHLPEPHRAPRVELDAAALRGADCVIITTDHSAYDYAWIAAHSALIVDTRNALAGVPAPRATIITL